MAEPATKDDIERVLGVLQEIANRIDKRHDDLVRRVDRYAARGEIRLRSLETTEDGTKERLQIIETQMEDLQRRLKAIEDRRDAAS